MTALLSPWPAAVLHFGLS